MSRFSPRVSHNGGRVVGEGVDRLAAGLAYRQDRERMERLDAEDQKDRELGRAFDEVNLYSAGARRGAAPTRDSQLFDGSESLGQFGAPRGGGVSPLSMGFEQARGAPPERPKPRELVVRPGALIPGQGFADRPIYSDDPELGLQRQDAVQVTDPRYEQLTDDRYLDTRATPDARAARAQQAELSSAFELARIEREQELADDLRAREYEVYDDARTQRAELDQIEARGAQDRRTAGYRATIEADDPADDPTIRGDMGREFPDTPEGRAAALEWRTTVRGQEEGGDPAAEERRKGILELAGRPPVTETEQTAVNMLSSGAARYAEDVTSQMWDLGFPDEEIEAVEAYLRHPSLRRPSGGR